MKTFLRNAVSVVIGALIGLSLYFYSPMSFFTPFGQKEFLAGLEQELRNGHKVIKLEKLLPEGPWDTVCMIPPYAFNPWFSEEERIQKYYGKAKPPFWLFLPDPISERYVYGFAAIQGSEIVFHVTLKITSRISWSDRISNISPYFMENNRQVHFQDHVIKLEEQDICLKREEAILSFIGSKTMLIARQK
jgi:hypothetical protein